MSQERQRQSSRHTINGVSVREFMRTFAATIEPSLDAISACDPDGTITHWNRAATRLFGYSAEEAIGRSSSLLVPETTGHEPEQLVADARDERALHALQTPRQHKDGRLIHVSVTVSPIVSDQGRVLGSFAVSRDVSALIRVQSQLRDVEQRLNEAQALAHVGSWNWEVARELPNWTAELCRIYGYEAGHVPSGEDLFNRVHPYDRELLGQRLEEARAGVSNELEYRIVLPDGERRHVHAHHSPKLDARGTVVEVHGVVQDITERKHYESELERLATHDPLTALPNRRTFDARLELELARSARDSTPVSLAMMDIDHFKYVNDTFGHPAGDRVLARVGEVLAAQVREDELVARVGGEEFAWVLHGTDSAGARIAVERARLAVAATDFGEIGPVTLSAGICTLAEGADGASLYRCADLALLGAKRSGRDRVVVAPGTFVPPAPTTALVA